jgi:hypothetical protein
MRSWQACRGCAPQGRRPAHAAAELHGGEPRALARQGVEERAAQGAPLARSVFIPCRSSVAALPWSRQARWPLFSVGPAAGLNPPDFMQAALGDRHLHTAQGAKQPFAKLIHSCDLVPALHHRRHGAPLIPTPPPGVPPPWLLVSVCFAAQLNCSRLAACAAAPLQTCDRTHARAGHICQNSRARRTPAAPASRAPKWAVTNSLRTGRRCSARRPRARNNASQRAAGWRLFVPRCNPLTRCN